MRLLLYFRFSLLLLLPLLSCNNNKQSDRSPDTIQPTKPVGIKKDTTLTKDTIPATYSNNRFKDVKVERLGDTKFRITGRAQVFEATFSWVIEDGQEELQKGFQMTDAGAPEWGKFSFIIDAPKKRDNSTLHLILFEASAKDGSRQFELPIPLY